MVFPLNLIHLSLNFQSNTRMRHRSLRWTPGFNHRRWLIKRPSSGADLPHSADKWAPRSLSLCKWNHKSTNAKTPQPGLANATTPEHIKYVACSLPPVTAAHPAPVKRRDNSIVRLHMCYCLNRNCCVGWISSQTVSPPKQKQTICLKKNERRR